MATHSTATPAPANNPLLIAALKKGMVTGLRECFVCGGRVGSEPIPDDVRRFILSNGLTVPDVEALLMFRGSGNTGCETALLASRLYIPSSRAEVVVAKLQSLGAIKSVGGAMPCVYRPVSTELSAVLEALLLCYAQNLIQVAQLIHSTEAQSAQAFADAFRIRKET